jgi:hypothetical protein
MSGLWASTQGQYDKAGVYSMADPFVQDVGDILTLHIYNTDDTVNPPTWFDPVHLYVDYRIDGSKDLVTRLTYGVDAEIVRVSVGVYLCNIHQTKAGLLKGAVTLTDSSNIPFSVEQWKVIVRKIEV